MLRCIHALAEALCAPYTRVRRLERANRGKGFRKSENDALRGLKERIMDRYECPCGYVYDPQEGDYEQSIEPGTPFDELPETWVCPLCEAEKEYFGQLD